MKTIEIQYTRKVTFNKIIEVTDKIAKRALSLDGEDLYPKNGMMDNDFYFIADDLTDMNDIMDAQDEIEDLSVTIYNPKSAVAKKG